MNHSAQNSVMGTDSLLAQSELCEVCSGKDDEDLYIVFNALYRIVSGDIFYQGSESIENELIMNPLSASLSNQKQRSLKTSQEKLQLFKKKLSSQGLLDLVALPRFDLLLREIFKSKYNRVQDTSCKHQELAMNFIRNFNLKNDEFLENSDMNKRKLMENTEKLDMLYNKIKQLKSEIESYHSEIDGLSERIVKKLLPNNSHFISKKLNVCNEDRDDSDDQGSDDDDFADKKLTSSNDSMNANNSTGISSESSTSDEEKLERKHKKSKTATFKSKLPKKATDVLKNWFLNNIQNPYPSHEAKETLSKMTGLTRKQIQNWFTNSRKRFLEPLKKKIDGQKLGKDGSFSLDQAGDLFTSETQSQVDPTDSVCPSMSQEPIIVSQTLSQQSQSKPSALSFTPPLQILNDSATKASSFQNSPPQLSPQSAHQPILYPQTNNIVVVPWVLPQTVYPYRPGFPNLLSMNTPSLIPLQQNNYPSNYPLMDPSAAALQNQFPFAIQPNLMDANTMMKQQLSNNFNAINANLYNNFAHPGSVGQLISANQERMSLLNKMSPYATPMGMNSDPALYKLASEGLHRSTSGLFHPRPDLSEIGILGKKYIHKDEYLRANLS